MTCDGCGHGNQPGAKFCSECGTALRRACTDCGADLSPSAKFCDQCGLRVDAAAASTRAAVRKQVTALFADLVGSTGFGERLDPEAARSALAPYFELLRSAVEDQDGTVVKYTGDGVFAVFGVPEVAEDDALRAVAAGLELQRRFRTFASGILERHGVELGLRVGINSGELVVADDDADLVGDVLNTAARLEAECAPGRVLAGEDTWRLTRSVIEYDVLGEVQVKGKAEPIATFQVVDDESTAAADDTPFVGRSAELRQLLDTFEEARDSPVARLVTIIGAPGVGKTRLAAELRAAAEVRSFDLRFERRGSTTFTPVADLLREVTDGTPAGVSVLFDGHREHERLVPVLQSFLGHGPMRSTEESFWATRRLLEHLTTEGPVVLVVDDIQWAEPLFWDLLDHLVEWAEAPVLIVALARPELRELRPELAQPGRRVAATIALEGLDPTSTRELAARLLDTEHLPDELLERIPDTTDGNPLFVRELVQMLVEDGTLARDEHHWRLTIDVDAIDVPPTVLSLLATRVERLPDDERRLIELASVIGTEFDRGTLAALAGDQARTGLAAVIDRLRRRDLVEPSGAWSGDQPVYRFHHVLVRDAAYRRLLKMRRAELHELVGHHVLDGDGADVTVAHHFELAVRYRHELGARDDSTAELAALAVERLRQASDLAIDREDLPAAGAYARRALALVGDDDPVRDELLLLGCEALLSSGDVATATPLVRELHERSSDSRLAAWADCFRAQRWSLTDGARLTEAADLADDAARRLDGLDDASGVAKARLVRATCLARLGRVGDCEAELDLALGAARAAGDRRRTVAVLGAAPAAALWGPSPVARAGGRCLDVLRLLRITTASPAVEATSVRCQGMLEALRGRFDSAREKLELSRSAAHELGLRHGLFETELFAGFVELWADDPVAATPHLRAAHAGFDRLGLGADAGQAGALLAHTLLRRGDVDEADRLATASVDAAGQNLKTAMSSRAALAEVRAVQGRDDEARTLLDEALSIAEDTDIALDHALVLMAAHRVAIEAGRLDDAAHLASRITEVLDMKGVTLAPASAASGTRAHEGLSEQRTAGTLPHLDRSHRETPEQVSRLQLSGPEQLEEPIQHNDAPTGQAKPVDRTVRNRASDVFDQISRAISSGDRATLDRLHTDDLVPTFADRLDLRPRDRDEYLDFIADSGRQHGGADHEVVAVRGDDLCLIRYARERDDLPMVRYTLVGVRDGRRDTTAWFAEDQYDEAIEALDREFARRSAPAPASNELANRTTRLVDEYHAAVLSGDRDRMLATVADDIVYDTHRAWHRAMGAAARTGEDVVDSTLHLVDRDGLLAIDRSIVALRGERLALVRVVYRFREGTTELYVVYGSDEHRLTRFAAYDTDGLVAALDELDRCDDQHDARIGDVAVRTRAAFAGAGLDTLPFSDDFVTVDHRLVGLGSRNLAEYVESSDALVPSVSWTTRILAVDGDVGMWQYHLERIEDDNAWDLLHVGRLAGDELAELHVFAVDQHDEARTEFDRLRAAAVPGTATPPIGNRSWEVYQRAVDAIERRDRSALDALHTDDFTPTWNDPLELRPTRRDEYLDFTLDRAAFGAEYESTPLAVRGDDLCLLRNTRVVDGEHLVRYTVLGTKGGQCRLLSRYSEHGLADALDELDRRWVDGPAVHMENARRARRAFAVPGFDLGVLPFADDFVTEDHRLVGMGRRSRDDFIASSDLLTPSTAYMPQVVDWAGDVIFYEYRIERQDDEFAWHVLHVAITDEAGLHSTHVFGLDQYGEARAFYERLVAERSG